MILGNRNVLSLLELLLAKSDHNNAKIHISRDTQCGSQFMHKLNGL